MTSALSQPDAFSASSSVAVRLAYDLGIRGFEEYPEADALFIGGGWLSQPVIWT